MEELTKKEALAVEFVMQGNNHTEAVMKSYKCKTRDSARSLAAVIFKKPKVCDALAARQREIVERLADKDIDFIEMVEHFSGGKVSIARKLAQNLMSDDKRVSDSALEKYLKLCGLYSPEKIAIQSKNEFIEKRNELISPE